MSNIHILWCTIRPDVFLEMHKEWINRSMYPEKIKTYIAVNWKEHADQLRDYIKNGYMITLNTNKIGVCYPSYQLSSNLGVNMGQCENDDIVVFASDDFLPPNNWDDYLINKLKDKGDVGLMIRDGYQLPDSSNMIEPAVTIPIMTYGALLKMNRIIYNPVYAHMFSDIELYYNMKELGILYDDRLNDETVFEHRHYVTGKRPIDNADKSYNLKWREDELTWNERKKLPVEKRIKIND